MEADKITPEAYVLFEKAALLKSHNDLLSKPRVGEVKPLTYSNKKIIKCVEIPCSHYGVVESS